MSQFPRNILFLCAGNSARSIFAEALLNHWGRGRFRGYSAGSHPHGGVHPLALHLLRQLHLADDGLRSKPWSEFVVPGAPRIDYVITVCERAAAEPCPNLPGRPTTAHWGIPDPAAAGGDTIDRVFAFRQAFQQLENRIRIFASLPFETLDDARLQRELEAIGRAEDLRKVA